MRPLPIIHESLTIHESPRIVHESPTKKYMSLYKYTSLYKVVHECLQIVHETLPIIHESLPIHKSPRLVHRSLPTIVHSLPNIVHVSLPRIVNESLPIVNWIYQEYTIPSHYMSPYQVVHESLPIVNVFLPRKYLCPYQISLPIVNESLPLVQESLPRSTRYMSPVPIVNASLPIHESLPSISPVATKLYMRLYQYTSLYQWDTFTSFQLKSSLTVPDLQGQRLHIKASDRLCRLGAYFSHPEKKETDCYTEYLSTNW
ncbi:hypothetical protein DPMN_152420 [Dreissena polymorpha]|uniref:Uncharacterized protein n=1 Tax=Dreissena polymorpha TaxID=45954 RepID=A0A9D4J8B8_DREPO|nr:hypothetical protein DPMN_152420 [Dreissena polymorpha]